MTPTMATSPGPCSTWSTPSRMPAPTAPATAGSSRKQHAIRRTGCRTAALRAPGYAPYLDYRPLTDGRADSLLTSLLRMAWRTASWKRRQWTTPRSHLVPRAPGRGAPTQGRADRQDDGSRQGPADQGDQLLGPPGRAAQGQEEAGKNASLNSAWPGSGPTSCKPGCRNAWRNWSRSASSRHCHPWSPAVRW